MEEFIITKSKMWQDPSSECLVLMFVLILCILYHVT